jgi:hypothetical protein
LRRIRERHQDHQTAANPAAAAPQMNDPFPNSPSLLAGPSTSNAAGSSQSMPPGGTDQNTVDGESTSAGKKIKKGIKF